MNSKEALERLKDDIEINYLSTKHSNEKDKSNYLIKQYRKRFRDIRNLKKTL